MGRLIDVDAASEIVRFECGKWEGLANTIIKEFYALKPVDAVPVVHGRWECGDKYENAVCSVCGYDTGEAYGFGYGTGCYKFCPNCGAKMNKKGR